MEPLEIREDGVQSSSGHPKEANETSAELHGRLFCCCSASAGAGESGEQHVAHSYICGHILQEAAWRIQNATKLSFDPFVEEGEPKPPYLLSLSAGSSADSSKGASFSVRDSGAAKEALLQNSKVALLLDYYERLLAADVLQLVARGGRGCSPWAAASSDDLLGSRIPHCHLFREEDLVAQKLLSAYEVYAYLARCSSGEQLTTKLRSCLQYAKEMRESCGLPRTLNPLMQAAAAAVAVYRRDNPPPMQQALLQQKLQQMQQLPHQVQELAGWLCRLKAEHPQRWKQWLGHLQQRRLLRLQRDQQRQQFAAAGESIEKLWQQLQHYRDMQQFDGTGLQMELLLLSREEEADRQQLGEEIAAEVEELLTYAVDTALPQQLPPFDLSDVLSAILSKLYSTSVPLPGTPLRLLLLSSKELPETADGARAPASASAGETAAAGKAAAAAAGASLPLQEQLRRCLCRTLSAVVSCRVNERSAGGQQHLALHFPFFSTAAAFPIAPPVPPETLPLQYRQQLQQQQQQTHQVLASFHATLDEPLDSVSLHVGVSHPGLPRPIEALVAVPLPPQLSAMREEYVRSNSVAGEPSTAYHPSPVSFCVDIPFSSVRSSKLQQQQQEQQQTAETGAEVGKEFSQQSRSVNSMHDPQPQGSCVVPLPSFLSLETAAARDRRLQQQLQQQPLLSTPAWGEPVTADITALDIERAADAAAQRAEAQRNRSMLAAAVVSARAASAVGVAEAVAAAAEARAAASSDAPTTRKMPFSSAATRLRSALSRFPHAGNREQEPPQSAATAAAAAAAAAAADVSPTSYEGDSPTAAAAGAAAPGEAVEEAAPAARAAYRSEAQHSASRPEEESRGPQRAPSSLACSFPIESSGLKEIATATERDENEASAVEMSSLASVLPFE
ncbi:uncharacterized protein EMH_0048140 [Eimeria mitis]|uniref:Uncharacterized protein n=1 Tax=Eimeria mitis TaxID=44415 RepID=U6K0G5_9EIME|nr:uncharacterized protein EMH_0048140 [Eimeria mitis]CDJ29253.1 hypothetical protein, conserved [Eimeria mitis]